MTAGEAPRRRRRARALAGALFVLAGCGGEAPRALLDWTAAPAPTLAPDRPMPRLSVDGVALRAGGRTLRLRGLNVCSLEFDAAGANWRFGDGRSALLDGLADEARWGANVVRVPVNQQWFNEDDAYVGRVEGLIDQANQLGVYVILDVQWEVGRRLEPYQSNILEVPTFGPGNTTEAFWHRATSRWANRTNLLFDLINEPHGRGDEETAEAMQVLVDALRTRDRLTPIVIGGMNWAHSVDFYARRPLRGAHLIYSAHQYLPYDEPTDFHRNFGRAATSVPVLLGEFLADASTPDYAVSLVEAAESAGAVGWLPWAIGCGIAEADDEGTEPFRSLAGKMRALNQ